MKYILYNIKNVNNCPVLELIDEGYTTALDSTDSQERWFQERIAVLRTDRELHQVIAWMNKPVGEGAFIGMELVQSGVIGPFHILIQ